ncbi:helix-turn-helix domain-containing protein [Streptomyces sp. NPDC058914]|uniref:helix-turn-helix domain-containing protein n=1 Tax=Streptomyces sp. NPDC058914 TaxID=3346671 RepID=UPI0036A21170
MENSTPRPVDPALDQVLRDTELVPSARLVWIHLRNRPSGQRKATIVRALGVDKAVVYRAIKALAERGLVCDEDGVWTAVAPKEEG